jgi:redox-sensitive bicupin YhaK (pirin superfamily)
MTTINASSTVFRRDDQFQASHGGILRANKPVVGGYTVDHQATGGLFYWSHSRFDDDFEFGLHPHQGFEIVTFVLEGDNSHYDTASRKWSRLSAGDVQIIRSGSGLHHNEKVAKGARAFQVWFDPGFSAALEREPSYTDHPAEGFTSRSAGGLEVLDLIGGSSDVYAVTEGLTARRVTVRSSGRHTLDVPLENCTALYVIEGEAQVNGAGVTANDALISTHTAAIELDAKAGAEVFIISLPANPSYLPVRQGP